MRPAHPQLMDPATDPEALIAGLIYYYPLTTPTRTEALDHIMLTNGNGYEWGDDGNIRSVFSHIEPEYDRIEQRYEKRASTYEAEARTAPRAIASHLRKWARRERKEAARLLRVSEDYQNRARTYGPIQTHISYGPAYGRRPRIIDSHELKWTLLGRAPENVTPAWQRIIDETRLLFAPLFGEREVQGMLW